MIIFNATVNDATLIKNEIMKYATLDFNLLNENEKMELHKELERIILLQDELGFFPIVIDEYMPGDAIYEFNRKPTYVILSVLMKTKNSLFIDAINKCLEGCKKSKFFGKGYDFRSEQCINLAMLLDAGIMDYADDELKDIIKEIIKTTFFELLTGQTSFGFGSWKEEGQLLIRTADQVGVKYMGRGNR